MSADCTTGTSNGEGSQERDPLPNVPPCPFPVFDKFGSPADERVHLYAIVHAAAAQTAERDCRTCRNFRGTQHCDSVLRCVDGSSYQRGGVVQLWEVADATGRPGGAGK